MLQVAAYAGERARQDAAAGGAAVRACIAPSSPPGPIRPCAKAHPPATDGRDMVHEYDCLLLEHVLGQRPDDAHKASGICAVVMPCHSLRFLPPAPLALHSL